MVDASGKHIPILDIDAPIEATRNLVTRLAQLPPIFVTYKYRFHFGKPEQLTLDQYKTMMIEMNKKEKGMPKTWKKIEKAENFFDAMSADIPPLVMRAYLAPIVVKNWIDVPRKYRESYHS